MLYYVTCPRVKFKDLPTVAMCAWHLIPRSRRTSSGRGTWRETTKRISFLPDAYPGHSGESFCSSDLSLDGTDGGFDIGENDGGGADGSHQGASHAHHGSSSHDTPSLSQSLHAAINNPIDKLFMMQSSYFSGDHA